VTAATPTIAAIDVGSSATRLVVAQIGPRGPLPIHRQRAPIRLGTEVFASGRIGEDSQRQLVQAFGDLAKRLRAHHVVAYRAVATSALRDAANGRQVLDAVHAHSGIRVRIISGDEEAELMRQALLGAVTRHGQPEPAADALLLDLGGGSLELMRADGQSAQSLPMGTVRLLGRYTSLQQPMSVHDVVHLSEHLVRDLAAHLGPVAPAPLALGTGGNVHAMAQGLPGGAPFGLPTLRVDALLPAACALGPLPLSVRAKSFGLHHGRADLLLPAVLIVHAVGTLFNLQDIVVPGAGIRDALLDHLCQELTPGS
jgi:exopolyphosphatase/guanosine-5'-triphosphate,3'-diphosphate pyrophosphatase